MKTRLTVLLFFWSFAMQAQQITTVEYFFDTDPGFGNATQIILNSTSLDSTFNFTVSAMSAGLHTLFVRLKNSDNKWSTLYQENVLIVNGIAGTAKIIKAEYFYDTDPGIGNGTSINLSNTNLDSTLSFGVTGLTLGAHSLFVRLQNSNNNWSTTYQNNFLVWQGTSGTPQIQSLQYFVDSVSNAVQLPLNLSSTLDTTVSIPIPDNGKDSRKLGLRMKNQTGELGNATIASISLCDLYKPKGGFRFSQYGNTFTLIDSSRFNLSHKTRWMINNVLRDSSYTINYTFPSASIPGNAIVTELTGIGCRVDTAIKILNMPGVESYLPWLGAYNSDFILTIYGGGLDTTLTVFLKKGDTTVYPYNKFSYDNGRKLVVVFDFHNYPFNGNASTTLYDLYRLHVIYPGGYEYTDPVVNNKIAFIKQRPSASFCNLLKSTLPINHQFDYFYYSRCPAGEDVPGQEPYFATDLTGNSAIRTGIWNNQTFSITNTGTVVAKSVPFFILLPDHFDIDTAAWNILTNTPSLLDSINIIVPIDTFIDGRHIKGKLIALLVPYLAPGETKTFPIRIRTTTVGSYKILYWATKRMYGSPFSALWGPCFDAAFDFVVGFIPVASCVNAVWNLANSAGIQYFSGAHSSAAANTINVAGTILSCIPGGAAGVNLAKSAAGRVISKMSNASIKADQLGLGLANNVGVGGIGLLVSESDADCFKTEQELKKKNGSAVTSFDPNKLTGNSDHDSVLHYINNYSPQYYTINFENLPTATGNAQHVFVVDTLNTNKLINFTFIADKFTIADSTYYIPVFRNQVTMDVGLKNRNNLKVRFSASFDTTTGIFRNDFYSIDTTGKVLPLDSLDGFLPPNTDGVKGTGSISFSIYARNLNTLDTFSNKAFIYFDNNAPIPTNKWINTVDTTAPTGAIMSATIINDTTARLIVGHSDVGSGFHYNKFYVKRSTDSLFRYFGSGMQDTILIKGAHGQTYQLYSRAVDNVGNRQNKTTPDITVIFSGMLPLSLLSFTGSLVNYKAELKWITANEMNTSRFDVEKSTDGSQFKKLNTVAALGNTGHNNAYTSFDDHPAVGNNYYRLKQFDNDGRFVYSTVVKIYYGKDGLVTIAPNPAKDFVEIKGTLNLTQIQLIDLSGKVVKVFIPSANNIYKLNGVSKGLYFIRLINGANIQTHKLLIE